MDVYKPKTRRGGHAVSIVGYTAGPLHRPQQLGHAAGATRASATPRWPTPRTRSRRRTESPCDRASTTASSPSRTGSARTRSTATCSAPSWSSAAHGWAYRFGAQQLNVHGPGVHAASRSRAIRSGPATATCASAGTGRSRPPSSTSATHGVEVELGPVRARARAATGTSVYFRDPDGSLTDELIAIRLSDPVLIGREAELERVAARAGHRPRGRQLPRSSCAASPGSARPRCCARRSSAPTA